MSTAKAIFDQFIQGGIEYIKDLKNKEIETEYLDFKTATSAFDKSSKQNLSEALSGFANSDGGVLVWGVDCRREKKDDPDWVVDYGPIANLTKFHTDLYDLTPKMVTPAILGVRHEKIEENENSNTGYIVSYVPKGESLPHMATAENIHRYMFRSGASFLKMDHWMLADRFGRRPQPRLSLGAKFLKNNNRAFLVIANTGKGLGMHVSITMSGYLPDNLSAGHLSRSGGFDLIIPGSRKSNHFTSLKPIPIPPGCFQEIGFYDLDQSQFKNAEESPNKVFDFIEYQISADDFWKEGTLVILGKDLCADALLIANDEIKMSPIPNLEELGFYINEKNIGKSIVLSGGELGGTRVTWKSKQNIAEFSGLNYRLVPNEDQAVFVGPA